MTSAAVEASRTILTRLHEVMASRSHAQAKLNTVAEVIGESLHSEVCSIYLLREGMLELFATRGLAQEAVHVTRMAVGEGLVMAANLAIGRKAPLIVFSASGGARMQEGILSLMQLTRTTIAVRKVKEAGLPYIVVLTDPTTGGVSASFAMLGDVHIAEPDAIIGFAGPRVIQDTIRQELPEGFQRSEYLLEHGMVDAVVHRHKLRETLIRLVSLMMDPVTAEGRSLAVAVR